MGGRTLVSKGSWYRVTNCSHELVVVRSEQEVTWSVYMHLHSTCTLLLIVCTTCNLVLGGTRPSVFKPCTYMHFKHEAYPHVKL